MKESLDQALARVVRERYGYLFPMKEVREKTIFEEKVLTDGTEEQRRVVLHKEFGDLIFKRKQLVSDLVEVNLRIKTIQIELNPEVNGNITQGKWKKPHSSDLQADVPQTNDSMYTPPKNQPKAPKYDPFNTKAFLKRFRKREQTDYSKDIR